MCTHDLQRFCCTLSLCTYPGDPARPKPIKSVFDDHVTASELFNSVQHIYKDWDYRCLVPYSHKNPTKWKTYEMHDYRKASSEEELKRVDRFKYDNNFFNWEDPKVLKYFTKNTNSVKKAWKNTYGFPYVSLNTWDGKNVSPQNSTKCFKKCAQYVSPYVVDCLTR